MLLAGVDHVPELQHSEVHDPRQHGDTCLIPVLLNALPRWVMIPISS